MGTSPRTSPLSSWLDLRRRDRPWTLRTLAALGPPMLLGACNPTLKSSEPSEAFESLDPLHGDLGIKPHRDLGPSPQDLRELDGRMLPAECNATLTSRRDQVCQRWRCDRSDLTEGRWSGNTASCTAGDISSDGRESALRLVNLYRFLAQLPAVTTDPMRDRGAQDCSLLMSANGQLSHAPPMTWRCYSNTGAQAAGMSNICGGSGVMCVDIYMADYGNDSTIGHRRWILSNGLGPIGVGSTPGGSCLWVIGGSGGGTRAWTAWPPEGPVPAFAIQSADGPGWTLQSDGISLDGAKVTVTDAGKPLPVVVGALSPGYGSRSAIKWQPQGWRSEAGHSYHVEVTNIAMPIGYTVESINCP